MIGRLTSIKAANCLYGKLKFKNAEIQEIEYM